MNTDQLQSELEQRFTLPELLELTERHLGVSPETVGGTVGLGSYVRALTHFFSERGTLPALADAVLRTKPDASPELSLAAHVGFSDRPLELGESIGQWTIAERLGDGPCGQCYVVVPEGGEARLRLKLFNAVARNDVAGMARFMSYCRALSLADGLDANSAARAVGAQLSVGTHHGIPFTAQPLFEGLSLASRLERSGPFSFEEALETLRPALLALSKLHDEGMPHGNIKPENILIATGEDGRQLAAVLDAGLHYVHTRLGQKNRVNLVGVAAPKTVAPEVLTGQPVTPAADVYSLGVLLFEMLTGSFPFAGSSPIGLAIAHMSQDPPPPSDLAPSGAITQEVDDFVSRLLSKHPDDRPASARKLLDLMETLRLRKSQRPPPPQEEIDSATAAFLADPVSQDTALALESMVEAGANAREVAFTFRDAAAALSAQDGTQLESALDLNFRAARLLRAVGEKEEAESIYVGILELDPGNRVATAAVEDLRRALGKYEDLVELWLTQHEAAGTPVEQAKFMANIGRLYEKELRDPAQALVAYCQAACATPTNKEYIHAIERVAGKDQAAWNEVIQTCSETLQGVTEPDRRIALLVQIGEWYGTRVHRLDLALQCYHAATQSDPSHAEALDGLIGIYRKAQQWSELAQLLAQRSQSVPPPRNRDLMVEAATLFATKLGDRPRAKELLERVLETDPLHGQATEALKSLYIESGDSAAYARLLERQIDNSTGAERATARCRLAQVCDQNLSNPDRAIRLYEEVLQESPENLDALRGLEQIQERTGRYRDLLSTLQRQLETAATPRQKMRLLARLALLHEQEFLDQGEAITALESLLGLDPKNEEAFTALERLRREEQNWAELASLYETHAAVVAGVERKAELLVERAKVLRSALESPGQAIETFEQVLALQPENAEALAGLADLRQASGDAEEALKAMESLARTAATPDAQADYYVRAAQLLMSRKELAGAVERYQLALEAVPDHPTASSELRAAYVELGDPERAINMLYELVEPMAVGTERAKLTAELARLLYEHTEDWEVAAETAAQALEWNDTSVDALFVLAAVSFSEERFEEACEHYARLMPHVRTLPRREATDSILHYVDALSNLGASQEILQPAAALKELAPDDLQVQRRLADIVFEHGDPEQAEVLYKELLSRFESELPNSERAHLSYLHAECLVRMGRLDVAISLLEDASDLDPTATEPLEALARAYTEKGDFDEAWEIKSRLLDFLKGDERTDLLVELGEFAAQKLNDREKATHCLVTALDERPNDRKTLTRLMQLYTEDKDWAKLVEVVLKLADFVTDDKQKAKYLMTAGMVSARELNDASTALDSFERVLELDPTLDKALTESLALIEDSGDFARAEKLLMGRMKAASVQKDGEQLRDTFLRLGALYKDKLNRVPEAIEAYEAAHSIDSSDKDVWQTLGELYATDSRAYFEKARKLYTKLLVEDPYRAEAYKALRRIYTDAKNADGAWCLCQALSVLKLAQPDEERFYKRMRSDDPAYAQAVLSAADYNKLVTHEDADPLLTALFSVIEPAVITSRGYDFHELGYDPNYAVDLAQHPHPVGQTLHYAAGVLGMEAPPAFDNTNDPGGLAFLDTKIPAISMGLGVLNADIHPQTLAYLSGRHLTYYRPGFFLRQLIGTGTGLKSWLFAAIKYISPGFPVAAELEGPVSENLAVLKETVPVHARDELARAVSKLLQNAHALDLKTWVNAVDYTADRIGFVLAHDLETAVEVVRGTEDDDAVARERVKQLVLYSISPEYLELRRHLRIELG